MRFKITDKQLKLLQEYTRKQDNIVFEEFNPFDHSGLYDPDYEKPDELCKSNEPLLKINKHGNAKIKHPYFSLPAGYSCPAAKLCLSKADPKTGKLKDGKETQFRCYAASAESLYPNTRNARWTNFNLLRDCKDKAEMVELILKSFYKQLSNPRVFRIHESGDFFNQDYFDAWMEVAIKLPNTIFYAYTKALPFWVNRLNEIPANFKLTASKGGRYDDLIDKYNLKYMEVVFSVEEAIEKRLKIDTDDSLAWKQDKPFAILLHGVQPKGTPAAAAVQDLKKKGLWQKKK